MLVKILKSSNGCTFKVGQLVKLGDKQGENLVKLGYAEQMPEAAMPRSNRDRRGIPAVSHSRRTPPPLLLPPRHICGCGFVGKSDAELAEHKAGCR